MQQFKVDYFKREWPGTMFPNYYSLNDEELLIIQNKLFTKFLSNKNGDLLELVQKIEAIGLAVDLVNAMNESFSLLDLFSKKNIYSNDFVYINWYRFDDIDRINFSDLDKFFDDIWYPGSDDIDIFDDSISWILSVKHDGTLALIQPE